MKENNILLAKFLGWKEQTDPTERWFGHWFTDKGVRQSDLFFDIDWGDLMKVVEKIESVGYIVHIKTAGTLILDKNEKLISFYLMGEDILNTKIKTVYNACVEFVEWWNKNN